jgi:hypothetical protein
MAAIWMLALCCHGPDVMDGAIAPLSLSDLPAYRAALAERADAPASAARFRDFWDDPSGHAGRCWKVRGRLARRFRQAAHGDLPALCESWLLDEAGNPLCVVHPSRAGAEPELGDQVAFQGRFLRLIAYPGADTRRLAPLLVGPAPPVTTPVPATAPWRPDRGVAERWIALGLGAVVLGLLMLPMRRRRRARQGADPDPEFVGPEAEEPADDTR